MAVSMRKSIVPSSLRRIARGGFNPPRAGNSMHRPRRISEPRSGRAGRGARRLHFRYEIDVVCAKARLAGLWLPFRVADDMAVTKKTNWETWLDEAAKQINPDAPRPLVLTASDLANWANRFQAQLIIEYFRPKFRGFYSLGMWRRRSRVSPRNSSRSITGSEQSWRFRNTWISAEVSARFSPFRVKRGENPVYL